MSLLQAFSVTFLWSMQTYMQTWYNHRNNNFISEKFVGIFSYWTSITYLQLLFNQWEYTVYWPDCYSKQSIWLFLWFIQEHVLLLVYFQNFFHRFTAVLQKLSINMHGTRIYVNFMLRSTTHDFLDININNLHYI